MSSSSDGSGLVRESPRVWGRLNEKAMNSGCFVTGSHPGEGRLQRVESPGWIRRNAEKRPNFGSVQPRLHAAFDLRHQQIEEARVGVIARAAQDGHAHGQRRPERPPERRRRP